MRKLFATLLICFFFIIAINCNNEFNQWMKKYNKVYKNHEEYQYRFKIFQENAKIIEEKKKMKLEYTIGLNKFSDLTKEEANRKMGAHLQTSPISQPQAFDEAKLKDVPTRWDWREHNAVTNVKTEGDCGGSPYYSVIGALEGAYAIATGDLTSLSVQQLISCDNANDGCNGGFMTNSYNYILKNGGIESEKSYPYDDNNGTFNACLANPNNNLVSMYGYINVTNGNELALQYTVASAGPVSAAFYFNLEYTGGVYYNPSCPPGQATTGVTIVGYDTTANGTDYWIGKLPFGPDYGIDGYIWIARNRNNNCGIASFASFPVGVHKSKNNQ